MDSIAAEDPSIWRCCLDVARQLISKNLDFCFDLKVGTFSISLDAQKTRRHLLSREAAKSKPKHKSPSTIKRNEQRMDQFLSRKRAGAFSGHHPCLLILGVTFRKYQREHQTRKILVTRTRVRRRSTW